MLARYDLILSAHPTGEATILLTSPQPWDKKPRKGTNMYPTVSGQVQSFLSTILSTLSRTQRKEGPIDGESVAQLLLAVKFGKGFLYKVNFAPESLQW